MLELIRARREPFLALVVWIAYTAITGAAFYFMATVCFPGLMVWSVPYVFSGSIVFGAGLFGGFLLGMIYSARLTMERKPDPASDQEVK